MLVRQIKETIIKKKCLHEVGKQAKGGYSLFSSVVMVLERF